MRRIAWAASACLVLLAAALTACSTGGSGDRAGTSPGGADAAAFPVTIMHALGSTTIPDVPTRVATVSWVNADVALALGVVPVGMPKDEWGNNAHGSTPWKDAALERLGAPIGSDRAPAQYSEADGIDYTAIAAVRPDVILAAYSGLTKQEYDKLSKIAPVVAYPERAYGTPWQDSTLEIGKALGREDQARRLVERTEKVIADEVAKYPQLAGKSFIYGNLDPASADSINLYTAIDNRSRFLTEIGMKQAEVVTANTKGDAAFYISWSAERADQLAADVFVTWVPDEKTQAQIASDPLLGQIPAIARGSWVAEPDNTLTLAISAASPLSLPWALEAFLPDLGAAAARVG